MVLFLPTGGHLFHGETVTPLDASSQLRTGAPPPDGGMEKVLLGD